MSARHQLLPLGALAFAAFGLIALGCRSHPKTSPPKTAATTTPAQEQVELYFPGGDGHLYPETREIQGGLPIEERATEILRQLLLGPKTPGLFAPLPGTVTVAWVRVDHQQIAYVDLTTPHGEPPPASGSQRELSTVYSIVDSLLLNSPSLHSVALLWNERQRETFSGHVDTTRPLLANRSYLAASS